MIQLIWKIWPKRIKCDPISHGNILSEVSMEPDQQAAYEAEAESYFDSIRVPFEQTLRATKLDYPKFFARLAWLSGFVGVATIPLLSNRVIASLFHTKSLNFLGKSYEIQPLAVEVFIWCAVLGPMGFGGIARVISKGRELTRAQKPLPPYQMAFALSYAIKQELAHFERNKMELHQKEIINLWAKLLTYLRWTLDLSLSVENASFHRLPPPTYLVAPHALLIAQTFNWEITEQSAYTVIAGLNLLHSRVTPRLSNGRDLQSVTNILRRLGNFLYTCIPEHRKDSERALWGYSELHGCVDALCKLPEEAVTPEATSAERFKAFFAIWAGVFTHSHVVVAFFAWWIVFQALFGALAAIAFHYFANLAMNSEAMIGLIGGPIAAAISMVGITRKIQ